MHMSDFSYKKAREPATSQTAIYIRLSWTCGSHGHSSWYDHALNGNFVVSTLRYGKFLFSVNYLWPNAIVMDQVASTLLL